MSVSPRQCDDSVCSGSTAASVTTRNSSWPFLGPALIRSFVTCLASVKSRVIPGTGLILARRSKRHASADTSATTNG